MNAIDRLPGAVWPILFGAIYAGLQVFVSAQWPDAPPATVLGIMTALGVLMGALKVLWPTPTVPLAGAAALPAGVAADASPRGAVAQPTPKQPGKVSRFLL